MFTFDWLSQPDAWVALATLALLEIILGIDNIIFISIMADKLPPEQRGKARMLGLGLAMFTRLALLASISWIMSLQSALFEIPWPEFLSKMQGSGGGHGPEIKDPVGKLAISGRDLILFFGGLFLIYKSTHEIHAKIEGEQEKEKSGKAISFGAVLLQIALLDLIFSLDSVITAVGMADRLSVMMLAVVISVGVMMLAAGSISRFVSRHPTIKILALSFLILIGTALVAEGLHFSIPKGYIYFAMAFSLAVEFVNMKLRGKTVVEKLVN